VPQLLPDARAWKELLASQDAVVSRAQAITAGWTDGQVTRHLLSGRWRRLHHGVFVTHTGPVSWRADVWAALLHSDVELPHGLPRAHRGERITVRGRHWYADARYARFRLRIELEGLSWHPVDLRWRDDVRDNDAVLSGDVVLRFGWRAVVGSPCQTAAHVAAVLRGRGWQGTPRPCSAGCPVGRLTV
jgi:hypothetical protein